jgi:hypothetical protein
MATAHDLLEQGIEALKAGRRAEARNLLAQVVHQDQYNETAWLWLSGAVDTDDERRTCLENVLTINPNNSMAKRGLESLKAKQGIRQLSPTPSPMRSAAPTAPPREQPTPPPAGAGTSDITQRERPKAAPKRKKVIPKQTTLMVGIGVAIVAVVFVTIVGVWWAFDSGLLHLGATAAEPTVIVTVPLPAPAATSTPTLSLASIPTWTPTSRPVSDSCRSDTLRYINRIQPLMAEFSDTMEVAGSTPRIALSPIIQDLQRIRRDIIDVPAPDCAQRAANLLISGMNNVINGFVDFVGEAGDATVEREISQGVLEMTNGFDQLSALASGKPTPIPEKLPTSTPIPTPLPTSTALPAGNPIVVDNWQIQVERVLTTETLSSSYRDSTEKAAGRFALVFMAVTNRALSPRTFVAIGNLAIRDATGRLYAVNPMANVYAQAQYDTDLGADINPDETVHVVAVFDVSKQSSSYVLGPGLLADPHGPSVLLDIP